MPIVSVSTEPVVVARAALPPIETRAPRLRRWSAFSTSKHGSRCRCPWSPPSWRPMIPWPEGGSWPEGWYPFFGSCGRGAGKNRKTPPPSPRPDVRGPKQSVSHISMCAFGAVFLRGSGLSVRCPLPSGSSKRRFICLFGVLLFPHLLEQALFWFHKVLCQVLVSFVAC